jgi:hypothetical protein
MQVTAPIRPGAHSNGVLFATLGWGRFVSGHSFSRAENTPSHLSFRIRFSGEESAFSRKLPTPCGADTLVRRF